MNKIISTFMAVLISGLLFYCPASAADEELYSLPKAGITEYIAETIDVSTKQILNEIVTIDDAEKLDYILPTYILSDEDADLLLRVGVLEAGGSDPKAIADVMQVVLNRFESDEFPNSIAGVIFQPKQFTTAKRLASADITPEAYVALDSVIFGENREMDALFFESCEGKIWANTYEYMFSYGGHDFYKLKED